MLVPVLDNDKHYWIGDDEVNKLLRHGETWLAMHPLRDQIVHRYLKHQKHLANDALSRLIESDPDAIEASAERRDDEEEQVERKISLNEAPPQHGVGGVAVGGRESACLTLAAATARCCGGCSKTNRSNRLSVSTSRTAPSKSPPIALHLDRLPEKQRQRRHAAARLTDVSR